MQNTQILSSAWSPLNPCKRRLSIFETQGRQFGQGIVRVFQTEAAVVANLMPELVSGQSHSGSVLEGLLPYLPAIPTEVSVAAIALLIGTSMGYLIAENMQKEEFGDAEPAVEWLLIINSTPFNRFVLMRCPSINFKDMDVYEGLSKRLTTEGHHVVRLYNGNSGMNDHYAQDFSAGQVEEESKLEEHICTYQRTFLHTDDGGVLAIDWPSYLELSGEHGLNTTILLVPGLLDGSKGKGIQGFVQRCARYGYFPIVLNPRGSGGSPLTTPRLFTAGDSDDVRTAVEFVLKSRPWATIMAVGWGYGANMLVKYLGEEAASTPLTAAVCIENIFDLEEANKLSQDNDVNLFDQKMASGFVQILKSNQMVFEGKGRDFDVQTGLSAKTVRKFDEAISTVSKGYNDVHELYKDSSSKSWIDNVKIPILCIQDNVTLGKTFSIPRHVFEKNPFTTLILSLTENGESISQANAIGHDSLVIEWLAGVELAFLKGRHPLLQDIDVTFKLPPKERSFGRQPQGSQEGGDLMVRKTSYPTGTGRSDEGPVNYLPGVNQRSEDLRPWYRDYSTDQNIAQKDSNPLVKASDNSHGFEKEDLSGGEISDSEKELQESRDTDASDDEMEQGKVRQAAESVMKVLDVTMPGTLSEKQKEEVLEAVGRGETVVSALQEACPEDVREKMATAVSAAVQARGISLKVAGFGKNMPAPKIPAGMVEKIQQNLSSLMHNESSIASMNDKARPTMSDPATKDINAAVGSGDQVNVFTQSEGPQKLAQEGSNTRELESSTSLVSGGQTENGAAIEPSCKASSDVEHKVSEGPNPVKERQDNVPLATEKEKGGAGETRASVENETNEPDPGQAGKQGDSFPTEQQKAEGQEQQESSGAVSQTNESHAEKKMQTSTDSSADDHNKKIPEQNVGEASPPQTPSPIPAASPLPSIDISRAFEALTGVDDSTQMAVSNVFGVIESVLEQLEKEQGKKDEQLEHSSSPIHESSMNGREIDTQKKDEAYVDGPRQLDLSEGTSRKQCPGKDGDELKEQLQKIRTKDFDKKTKDSDEPKEQLQEIRTKDVDKKTDSKCLPNLPTASSKSQAFDKEEEFDDANVALEYFEDENVWKLIDGSADTKGIRGKMNSELLDEHTKIELDTVTGLEENRVIDPEYIIAGSEVKDQGDFSNGALHYDDNKPFESSSGSFNSVVRPSGHHDMVPPLQTKVQELVIDALELELLRRLGNSDMRLLGTTLERDIQVVGLTMAETAGQSFKPYQRECTDEKASKNILKEANGMEDMVHVDTISNAVNEIYGNLAVLPSVLPAGVLFGIVLAALSPLGIVSTFDAQDGKTFVQYQREASSSRNSFSLIQTSAKPRFLKKMDGITSRSQVLTNPHENYEDKKISGEKDDMDIGNKNVNLSSGTGTCERNPALAEKATSTNNMMGAMATAMGATAALSRTENSRSSEHVNEKAGSQVDDVARSVSESDDEQLDKDENKPSIVSSLAEKAMSVAAPVVPTKGNGGVDHERLVEILAGLGHKGGILRFVGKVALLWGGLRGAMSLTDRLLVFFRMSDRPVYQRISGFMVMVLLLWSPVLVPLLPALLQQWASQSQNGIASTAALIGLYCAVVILINIWGKTIRGYEDPLHQYGVSIQPGLYARQLQSLLSGLTLGVSLVASVYMLGVSLDFIQFDWAPALSLNVSKTFLSNLISGWRIFKLMVQCFGVSLAVSFVEELFFRSWLQKEISVDLGFHKATAISGLAFSVSHWSLPLMPGLWFLSLILTGAKVGCNGDLNLAIGIHAGLMAGIQFINMYGNVKYGANASTWFIGHHSGDPFTGLIGVSILGVLALLFYPWGYNENERK